MAVGGDDEVALGGSRSSVWPEVLSVQDYIKFVSIHVLFVDVTRVKMG